MAYIDKDTYSRTAADARYKWEYDVKHVGSKYHGNSIMASLGIVGLKYLDEDNNRRRHYASLYNNYLVDIEGLKPVNHCVKVVNSLSSRHLYQIRVDSSLRNLLMSKLNDQGFSQVFIISIIFPILFIQNILTIVLIVNRYPKS